MILNDQEILNAIKKGSIVIKPFNKNALGTNSYDVHLGDTLAVYRDKVLDSKKHNKVDYIKIPEEGYVLEPGKFYLGVTSEYTETHEHVAFIDAKSSIARLGICIHYVAGVGDVGFCNHWTLEISVAQPVRVYANMPVAQLYYFPINYQNIIQRY